MVSADKREVQPVALPSYITEMRGSADLKLCGVVLVTSAIQSIKLHV
jgi:hypothetical protein